MAFTTEGWTIWNRAAGTQTVSSGDSTATIQALVAANPTDEIRFASGTTNSQIQTVLTAGTNPVAFVCGGSWNDVSLVDRKGRDYYAWYGTPSNGRPKFNVVSPDNSTGLKIEPGNADFDIKIIGLEFDGRRTGDAGDNWYGKDRDLLWVNINDNQDGTCALLIEDCYFHHCDTSVRLIDNHARFASVANEDVFSVIGGITGSMRRCLLRYATSLDSHAILMYTEGLGDGFVVEQCSFDKGGFVNSRNEDDPRGVVNGKIARNAGKEEHGIYNQRFGRPITARENYFSNIAANTVQSRPGGTYNYNVASRTGMLFTSLHQTGFCIGNVFADREDISTQELRGIGLQVYRGTGGTGTGNHIVSENIFYRPRFSSKKQRVIEAFGATLTARNNVAVNWGVLESEAGNGVFIIDGDEALGTNGNSRLSTGLARGYNDLSWPEDTEAEIDTRFSRGLGQWRPTTDHPGTFINEVRALAEAATDATLPEVVFANNGATSVGDGGLAGSPTSSLPTAYVVESTVEVESWEGVTLNGYAADADPLTLTYAWTTVSGPDSPTITFSDQPVAYVSTLSVGEYVFRLTVTNADENTDTADVTVTVVAAPDGFPVDPDPEPNPGNPPPPDDKLNEIEHAIANSTDGTVTFSEGTTSTSEVDVDVEINLVLNGTATIKRITTDPNDGLEASSTRGVVRFASGGSGSITGGTIDADGGSYSAIVGLTGSGVINLTNVNAINATFKQINLNGSGTITDCTVSSNVEGVVGSVPRPMAFQSDLESGVADYLNVNGLTIGMFSGSREGQMVKIARITDTDLNRITTPVIDSDTWYSLVMGEELDYVKIRNCEFPRKITHFADDTGGADTLVRLLVIADTTIGNEDEAILYLHDGASESGLLARTVIYLNVNFVNAGATCIIDDTPAADLITRVFIGCTFDTATNSTLISHRDGAGTLTGRIKWADCTFTARNGGSWTKPSDWDASEITLPTGYSLANLVEVFA